jgi:hypothetical protein
MFERKLGSVRDLTRRQTKPAAAAERRWEAFPRRSGGNEEMRIECGVRRTEEMIDAEGVGRSLDLLGRRADAIGSGQKNELRQA